MAFFTRKNRLHWLALLAVAIIFPTASLLWFMNRVIANERLVVREKLRVLYQDKLADATTETASVLQKQTASLDHFPESVTAYALFRPLVLEKNIRGLLIWDNGGALVYPDVSAQMDDVPLLESPLASAWRNEFALKEYAEALRLYDQHVADADARMAIAAEMGKARCLLRLGQMEEAIAECEKAAFLIPKANRSAPVVLTENARLFLLSLLAQVEPTVARAELFNRTVAALLGDLFNGEPDGVSLPPTQNRFIAHKVLEALGGKFSFDDPRKIEQLTKLTAAEERSLAVAEAVHTPSGSLDTLFKIRFGPNHVYGIRHQRFGSIVLLLLSDQDVASLFSAYKTAFVKSEAGYRVLDASGDFVAGMAEPRGEPFTVAPLPSGFPGWKVELYFAGSEVFKNAADRQIAIYVWTGFLMIALILVIGVFAIRAIGRQIRLNEMKNDFIATVSHELKTPLASMRVLVDTLLEGNVKDQAQVNQYLHLMTKENERLSRMIENFLTFSRMERNKVAFTLTDAKPAVIASDAVESVKTKFATQHCHLDLDIAPDLPEIQADHDAIVTVLVNLLDNACKYTGDKKRVSLRVSAENGFVFFSVADNGIGIARRHLRKVFDRFYQVDNSLARRAEGCGLGLSIVKFIVDAHKGKISVESKPGQGSKFTVQLPVGESNGNA